jgi:hypothetical protein
MNNPAKPRRSRRSPYCTHRTASGGRCRIIPLSGSSFCAVHTRADADRREAEDLAAALTTGLDEFTSAEPVNKFLSRLLLLLAQDRISPRRAAVMAYTANLLLRSVTVLEQHAAKEPVNIEYLFDIPRPNHDDIQKEEHNPQSTTE